MASQNKSCNHALLHDQLIYIYIIQTGLNVNDPRMHLSIADQTPTTTNFIYSWMKIVCHTQQDEGRLISKCFKFGGCRGDGMPQLNQFGEKKMKLKYIYDGLVVNLVWQWRLVANTVEVLFDEVIVLHYVPFWYNLTFSGCPIDHWSVLRCRFPTIII